MHLSKNVIAKTAKGKISAMFSGVSEYFRSEKLAPLPQGYFYTKEKKLNSRGIIWLGQTCNIRCHFCYFYMRVGDNTHPEHAFMTLEKANQIASDLRFHYGNDSLDIEGGEPTIWPHIEAFLRHCASIGLAPTLITNGIALASKEKCLSLKSAGLRDLLISVHGLGDTYDQMVQRPGSAAKQLAGIENCKELGIPFRFNCVLTKEGISQYAEIARHAVKHGALAVSFITFNPFEDQQLLGRGAASVPRHEDVAVGLNAALDILADAGVEANVRYFPLCLLAPHHRKSGYNFQQLSYDPHEWDYNSWHWTRMKPQVMRGGDLAPHHASLEAVVYPGTTEKPQSQAALYRDYARNVITQECGYLHPKPCDSCDLRKICDGVTNNYFSIHGEAGLKAVQVGGTVEDPLYYIRSQEKLYEPDFIPGIAQR